MVKPQKILFTLVAIVTCWISFQGYYEAEGGVTSHKLDFRMLSRGRTLHSVIKEKEAKRKALQRQEGARNLEEASEEEEEGEESPEEEEEGEGDMEEGHHGHSGHGEEQISEALVVFFVAVGLLIGAVCRELNKNLGIPYTPALMVIGALIGRYRESLGDFGEAAQIVTKINPHGILMIFIPTIIFESAFNADPFIFQNQIYQVLVLAGLGVFLGAFMLAFCFHFILGYGAELPFSAAMTFGSIVCATDPVAVVALLKELGTPAKFNLLLEGESLLNDGTAMVFYIICSAFYKGEAVTALGVVLQFVQLSIGGGVLGAVVCLMVLVWLSRIVKDDLLTISITFFSCYLTFFVGEIYFGVSGIIAIVTLGILMSMYGTVRINPESIHSLHSVWSFVQHAMETIIFIVTGLYIGEELLGIKQSSISGEDVIKMFIFFLLMILCRFIMISILYPLINKSGHKITPKDVVILTYGGLRGAIALALGLMVVTDEFPDRFKDLVLFFLIGMIALTVLVNGLTISYVMKLIGFNEEDPLKAKFRSNLNKGLVLTSFEKLDSLKHNKFFHLADWEDVTHLAQLDSLIRTELDRNTHGLDEMYELQDQDPDRSVDSSGGEASSLMAETRYRVYMLLKSQLWARFEEGYCSSASINVLRECCDLCMEDVTAELWMWECISGHLLNAGYLGFLVRYQDFPLIGYLSRWHLTSTFMQTYEILTCVILSIREVLKDRSDLPFNRKCRSEILKELKKDCQMAENRLFFLTDTFPEIIKNIQTKQAATIILNEQKSLIDHRFHNGMINSSEHSALRKGVEKQMSRLTIDNLDWQMRENDELLMIAPSLAVLSSKTYQLIKDSKEKKVFAKNEFIYQEKKQVEGLYIIARGVVETSILGQEASNRYGMGSILSYIHVVDRQSKALSSLKAVHRTVAYFVPKRVFKEAFEKDIEFRNLCHFQALKDFVAVYPPTNMPFKLEDFHVQELIKNSELVIKNMNELVELPKGGFMYYGEIEEDVMDQSHSLLLYNQPQLIKPTPKTFRVKKKVCIVSFNVLLEASSGVADNRMSLMRQSMGMSHGNRGTFMRTSVANMASLDGDVEAQFTKLVNQRYKEIVGK